MVEGSSLRELKQRRTREAIVDAAMALFSERGFDAVTVTEIAERAEVGRTTVFRYFSDKQEVLFADDEELLETLSAAARHAAAQRAPIGDSLPDAVAVVRGGLRALLERLSRRPHVLIQLRQLLRENPNLASRNLLKERRYLDRIGEILTQHGATEQTATLATGLGAACYWTAQTAEPGRLVAAAEAAFDRLAELGPA